MNGFEEQARSAAADAGRSTDHLPIPDLDNRPSAAARLVLATLAVLTIGLVGFATLRGGGTGDADAIAQSPPDPSDGDGPSAPPEVTYFGFPIGDDREVFATDLRDHPLVDPEDVPQARLTIFGAGSDPDRISSGYLVIAALAGDEAVGPVGTDIEVRGVLGGVLDGFPPDDSIGIEWRDPEGPLVQLMSDRFTVEELVGIAEQLEIGPRDAVLPAPPPGMELLVAAEEFAAILPTTAGWVLSSFGPTDGSSVTLTGMPGTEPTVLLQRIIQGATEPVEINGVTGYRSPDSSSTAAVVWAVDSTVLTITVDQGEVDAVQLARRVIPLSSAEWDALSTGRDDPDDLDHQSFGGEPTASSVAESLGEGTASIDGEEVRWIHYRSTDAGICLEVRTSDGAGSGQCGGDPTEPPSLRFTWSRGGTTDTMHGTVASEVARLSFETEQSTRDLDLEPVSGGALAFAVLLQPDEAPRRFTAFDGSGTELWATVIPDNPAFEPGGIGEETRVGPIVAGAWVGHELIGDTIAEWRLFVAERGTPCLEYVRGDLVADCAGRDSPDAIGGFASDALTVTARLTDGFVTVGGLASPAVVQVLIDTDLRSVPAFLHPTDDGSDRALYGMLLQPGESLVSVTALADSGEVLTRWGPQPGVAYPTTSPPAASYPTVDE